MHPISSESRVAFVQFGDFKEADERLRKGLGENYDAQKYSMEAVERIVGIAKEVSVICVDAASMHDVVLPSGVRSIGLLNIWDIGFRQLIEAMDRVNPTHIVLRFPSIETLRWAKKKEASVLATLADSFPIRSGVRGFVDRWRASRLAALLNSAHVTFVGNHNIAASRSLAQIGVKPGKIIPWDWPRSPTPNDFPVKTNPRPHRKKLICVGNVSEEKGVNDVLRAIASDSRLRDLAELDVLGGGEISEMQALAKELGIHSQVHFAGKVPFGDVAPAMHAADAVIVYSRHAYAEGLPGTIYLGLASRTPLVVSDHPMFEVYFESDKDVIIVPERNPIALAAQLNRLLDDTDLYATLSVSSAQVFERIVHPVKWADIVKRGLRMSDDDRAWLNARTLPNWP